MRRREFHRNALTAMALSGSAMAWAQGKVPADGADYISLEQPAATEGGPGKVDVVEFFWYSCPHCNMFEPSFAQWVKTAPKDVVIYPDFGHEHLPGESDRTMNFMLGL